MSCSMTRRSDAGEARNRGPLVSSSQCLNTKCGQSKCDKQRLDEYPSENMGIYMGVRKVWPFKCQTSENGQFIYFLY